MIYTHTHIHTHTHTHTHLTRTVEEKAHQPRVGHVDQPISSSKRPHFVCNSLGLEKHGCWWLRHGWLAGVVGLL